MAHARTAKDAHAKRPVRQIAAATVLSSLRPEQVKNALREARRVVLDRLATEPCGMLALRQCLPNRLAGALLPVMEAVVESGEVAAVANGLYAIVLAPNGMPVRAAPVRDLVVGCLRLAKDLAELRRYTGLPSQVIGSNLSKALKRGEIEMVGPGQYRIMPGISA